MGPHFSLHSPAALVRYLGNGESVRVLVSVHASIIPCTSLLSRMTLPSFAYMDTVTTHLLEAGADRKDSKPLDTTSQASVAEPI